MADAQSHGPVEARFSQVWSTIQLVCGVILLLLPLLTLFDKNAKDPVQSLLWFVPIFGVLSSPLLYFGSRGLARDVQIGLTTDGISGKLINKTGTLLAWDEIASVRYKGQTFYEWMTIKTVNGQKLTVRDFSLLAPYSLLEVYECIKTKLETGSFAPPKPNKWWESTWFYIVAIFLVFVAFLVAKSMFGSQ